MAASFDRAKMGIMEAVWPPTMLYWRPLGLVFYAWFGRAGRRHDDGIPMWQSTFKGAAHCGAGCALGDFIEDWVAYSVGLSIFGSLLAGRYAAAFGLAYAFGILFQYFTLTPMRHLIIRDGLIAAVKVDTVSLLAYQVGMFAWMAVRSGS